MEQFCVTETAVILGKIVKMKHVSILLLLSFCQSVCGGFLTFDEVPVMKGGSVTLNTGVETNQRDHGNWYFKCSTKAEVTGHLSKICEDSYINGDTLLKITDMLEFIPASHIIVREIILSFILSDSCTYVQCKYYTESFRGRLKLDHQTGSLTITNITNTESGEYYLIITSSTDSIFSVVHDIADAERDQVKRKSVKEGESVTLDPGVIKNPNDMMIWYFNGSRIAEITGDQSMICTSGQCKERFRDRLQLDHQTGSLTITITRTTDSGDYKLLIIRSRILIIRSFSVTATGFYGVGADGVSVFVMEGDSVAINTGVKKTQRHGIRWYFNNTLIAQIIGYRSFICMDFRDRLKLDGQTGSLTITNTRTTDSGDYKLLINRKEINSQKFFRVSVTGVPASKPHEMKRKSVKEGESVTLDPVVVKNPNDFMKWHFNGSRIAQITKDQSKICTDNRCVGRFRDRLQLNNQTGSLTITDTRTTDSGLYKLLISSSRFSSRSRISIIRIFSVTVTGNQ